MESVILRRVAALPSQPLPGPFTNGPYGFVSPPFSGVFLWPLPCGYLFWFLPLRLFRGAGLSLPFGLGRHQV